MIPEQIRPSAERVRIVIHYDPDSGAFTWAAPHKMCNRRAGQPAGGTGGKYRRVTIDGYRYYAHSIAWIYMMGVWPDGEVDHIDGDPKNTKWGNLRLGSKSMNMRNTRKRKNNTSGYKGVSFCRMTGRWLAGIIADGAYSFLGRHDSPEAAHQAYREAAVRLHGEYANFG